MGGRGDRRADRLAAHRGGRPLRRRRRGRGLLPSRLCARGGCDARARGRVRGAGRARQRCAGTQLGPGRRHHRLDGQDLDEGHPGCALPPARAHGRRRGRAQQRDRAAADADADRARHGGRRLRDGHARSRPDRRVVRDRAPRRRRDHEHRPGAPRARSAPSSGLRKRRRRSSPRCPKGGTAVVPDEPLLEPFLDRDDIEIRRFGPGNVEAFERVDGGCRVTFDLDGTQLELEFPFAARHQAQNAVAALLALRALGFPYPEGRVEVELSRWRGEESPLPGGGCSSTTPTTRTRPRCERHSSTWPSTRAARWRCSERWPSWAPTAPDYHREVGELVQSLGIDVVLGVGDLAREYGGELARRGTRRGSPQGEGARPSPATSSS